jgi:putative salt-induced outer membrane protein
MTLTILRTTAIAAAAIVASAAQAQAPAPLIKTDGQWRGNGGAALSATSGNTSASAFILNADGYRATADDKISFGALVNYGTAKVKGVKTTSAKRWAGFGQYDFNLSPQLFAFGRAGLEGDSLVGVDLDMRLLGAGGLGYRVINTPDLAFTVYGGLAYSADKYSEAKQIGNKFDDSFNRTSVYLAEESMHKLSSTVSFQQRLELYPGLTGDKAKLAKFSAGLNVAMSSTLNLNVGLLHSYNSKPPAGLKKGDTAVFTGVNVKFGAN